MDRKLWLHETVDRLGLHDLWAPEIALAIAPVTEHDFGGVLCQGMVDRIKRRYQHQRWRAGERWYEINNEIERRDNVKIWRNLVRLPPVLDNLVVKHILTARGMHEMHTFVDAAISFPQGYESIMKTTEKRLHIKFDPTLTNFMIFKGRVDTRDGPRRNFTLQSTFNFGKRPYTKCVPGNTKTDLYKSIPKNADIPCTWTFEIPAQATGVSLY